MDASAAKAELLAICDERYRQVRNKDWGTELPDRGKLLREGLRAGRKAVEETPLAADLVDFLADAHRRVSDVIAAYRRNPISDDGWRDREGEIVTALEILLHEIDDLGRQASRPSFFGWLASLFSRRS